MIVGCPRSGTTLLQQLLAGHPDVYTTQETHYFGYLLNGGKKAFWDLFYLSPDRFIKWKEYIDKSSIMRIEESFKRPKNRKEAVLFFIKILDFNAQKNNKKIWIEKTPTHLLKIKYIQNYFSDIYYLHIIRDPKDVVASLVDVGRKFPQSSWKGYSSIDRSIKTIKVYLNESYKYVNNPRHYFVQYNNLINFSEKEIKKIFNFLGVNFNDKVIQSLIKNFGATSVYKSSEKWKMGYGNKICKNRNNKFNKIFTLKERDYIRKKLKGVKILKK